MKVNKRVRYSLAILEPGDDAEKENELLRLEADKPFRNIHVGDEVAPRRWVSGRDDREHTMAGMLLRVTKLRHVIAECDGLIDHLTVVFTEDIGPVRSAQPARPTNPRRPGRHEVNHDDSGRRCGNPCRAARRGPRAGPARRGGARRGRGRAQAPRRVGRLARGHTRHDPREFDRSALPVLKGFAPTRAFSEGRDR